MASRKRIYRLGLMVVASAFTMLILTACFVLDGPTDPLGATSRTQIREDGKLAIEQTKADAEKYKAQMDKEARVAEAEQSAWGKVGTAKAWSGVLPTIVFIVAACVVVRTYLNWAGRIKLTKLKLEGQQPKLTPLPSASSPKAIAHPDLTHLQITARQRGMDIRVVSGVAYLVDSQTGETVARRNLLPPPG